MRPACIGNVSPYGLNEERLRSPRVEVTSEAESGRGRYIVSQLVEDLVIVPRAGGGIFVRVVLAREATLASAHENDGAGPS